MNTEAFVEILDRQNKALLEKLGPQETLEAEAKGELTVEKLLRLALKNEIEATELAARWLTSEKDIDVKMAFARQAGDEAKHYRLILDRLSGMGISVEGEDLLLGGWSPLFRFLAGLESTHERLAAGPFTREAIAVVKNNQFIAFCEASGDELTARMYRDLIEPDERYHHELGRKLLLSRKWSQRQQDEATLAARKTLQLADELQRRACETAGIHHAPGC